MNPFAERFEQKFARAQDQVARKPDGHRYSADKPQEAPVSREVTTAALVSRCAADIAPEKIEWLWSGRLALGKHICIAGEPGTGKSQLLIAIVATLTTGGNWPCGEGRAPIGNTIILSAEDGAADTIVARLLAAGADLNRVHVVSAVRNADGSNRTLNLQNDPDLLERKIGEIGNVVLVGVDPVSSYLGKTDSHKNSEVRGVLEPLSELAERMRVAVLSVTHFSKTGAGGDMVLASETGGALPRSNGRGDCRAICGADAGTGSHLGAADSKYDSTKVSGWANR